MALGPKMAPPVRGHQVSNRYLQIRSFKQISGERFGVLYNHIAHDHFVVHVLGKFISG